MFTVVRTLVHILKPRGHGYHTDMHEAALQKVVVHRI